MRIKMFGYGLLTTVMMACAGHGNGTKEARVAKNLLPKGTIEQFEKKISLNDMKFEKSLLPVDTFQSNYPKYNFDNMPPNSPLLEDLQKTNDADNVFINMNKDGNYVIIKDSGNITREATEYAQNGAKIKKTDYTKNPLKY